MHFTGYVFNDYARMLETLRWVATRIPRGRVLVLLSAWDGRYYWDYRSIGGGAWAGSANASGAGRLPMRSAQRANRNSGW
jgi:hypothetical protein